MGLSQRDAYRVMLREYPDVLNIDELCRILEISKKTAYNLLKQDKIACIKVGRAYRIPKSHLLTYLGVGSRS